MRAEGEFALWRAGTMQAIDTLLSSNSLTTVGADLVQRMLKTASSWMSEPVSAQARTFALNAARSHLARWEQRHGHVPRLAR